MEVPLKKMPGAELRIMTSNIWGDYFGNPPHEREDLLADVFADGINAARHHDEKHENAERDDQSGTRIVPPNVTQTTICYV